MQKGGCTFSIGNEQNHPGRKNIILLYVLYLAFYVNEKYSWTLLGLVHVKT